jgi:hypothetical protein
VNYTSALGRVTVSIPSSHAVFPTTVGGELDVNLSAATVVLGGTGWSAPLTGQIKSSAPIPFNHTQVAHFGTSKIAVMADRLYTGKVELAFRWQWSVAGQNGVWTVPTRSWSGAFLPSIFSPAPYVAFPTPAATAVTGTNYTVPMSGAVAHTMFRMVIEYPTNGTEIRHQDEYSAPTATTFNGTILLDYTKPVTPITPGTYIVHVHDVCDAIIHSNSVQLTANATGSGGTGSLSGPGVGVGSLVPVAARSADA